MDEAGEVDDTAVVASGETAEMLEATEASLDLVAMLVDAGIVRDGDLAVALARDHRLGVHRCDLAAQVVAIIRLVGEYRFATLSFEQARVRTHWL